MPGEVAPLRRPPLRHATLVRRDAAHTFDVFVDQIGTWWPLRPYSLGEERVVGVTFERRPGGRVYERWDDGQERSWGRVLTWDPPSGFTLSWDVFPAVTEVELTFRPLGPALTRVEVEHRGWEAFTEAQVAELCGRTAVGWDQILAALAGHLGRNR